MMPDDNCCALVREWCLSDNIFLGRCALVRQWSLSVMNILCLTSSVWGRRMIMPDGNCSSLVGQWSLSDINMLGPRFVLYFFARTAISGAKCWEALLNLILNATLHARWQPWLIRRIVIFKRQETSLYREWEEFATLKCCLSQNIEIARKRICTWF